MMVFPKEKNAFKIKDDSGCIAIVGDKKRGAQLSASFEPVTVVGL